MMHLVSVAELLLSATLLGAATAHTIQLPAHGRECFHENLHIEDKMTVTFQVSDREFGHAGNLEIDFWIANPLGEIQYMQKSVVTGGFGFDAKLDGKYVYCFGNEHWVSSSKEVSFNVHGVVYMSDEDVSPDPLEAEVTKLSETLQLVKDEQGYFVARERTHRNTAESTNSRVKWWNLFVIGVVTGESIFQVWWLRRFFEVKRVV